MDKKSQGLSITTIIVVVIGLIVIVVVIAIISGNLGDFSKTADQSATCENACKSRGADDHISYLPENCVDTEIYTKEILYGSYTDITLPNNICCCRWEV